eukprot:jgi/Mesvir1/22190/Mv18790-RA.4
MAGTHLAWAEASPLPGPGAYGDSRLEYKPQGPAFSIQGKAPERAVAEEDARRGPTLYETAPAYPSGPSYSMGTRPPAPRAQELPGPGDYGPMVEEMLPQGPAFTFGIRTDPEERKREAKRHLGPGTYEPGTQHLAQGPAYTIGVPLPAPAESPTPGPGQYFGSRGLDDPSAPRGPAFSIGQRVPVPGADERANIPGPGEYYVPSQPSGPAYSIAIRPTPAKVEAGPAPGTYDTPGLPDGLAFTMGTRRPAPDAKKDHPGPGDYAIPPLNDGPAFSMGVRPTPSGPSVPEPGPGDYWVPHLLGDGGPAFSMGVRVGAPSPGPVPGPGMYDNLPPSDAPSFTIGGRIPRKDPSRDVPGPAHYNVATLETGPAFSIGTRLGPPTGIHDLDLPGPGAYDVLVPPEGPAFTIATRTAAPEPDPIPGPGYYDADAGDRGGPAYSIGTAERVSPSRGKERLPGPGLYDIGISEADRGPSFTMGSRPPAPRVQLASPGPGDYDAGDVGAGRPSFTMGAKAPPRAEPMMSHVGPGIYNLERAHPDGPAYTIGGLLGPDPIQKERAAMPGPGDYDVKHTVVMSQEPQITIGTPVYQRPPDQVYFPGPGHYIQKIDMVPEGPRFTIGEKLYPGRAPSGGPPPAVAPAPDAYQPPTGPGAHPPNQFAVAGASILPRRRADGSPLRLGAAARRYNNSNEAAGPADAASTATTGSSKPGATALVTTSPRAAQPAVGQNVRPTAFPPERKNTGSSSQVPPALASLAPPAMTVGTAQPPANMVADADTAGIAPPAHPEPYRGPPHPALASIQNPRRGATRKDGIGPDGVGLPKPGGTPGGKGRNPVQAAGGSPARVAGGTSPARPQPMRNAERPRWGIRQPPPAGRRASSNLPAGAADLIPAATAAANPRTASLGGPSGPVGNQQGRPGTSKRRQPPQLHAVPQPAKPLSRIEEEGFTVHRARH